ncbi:MAG TPA: hypothetical protein VMM78_04150 [Thermomicrobiales bacterium]|nr:hypothetical protein [Thermomicrobiales bacterium]
MRVAILVLFVFMACLLASCGGEVDTSDAEASVRLRLEQLSRGEYGKAWDTLHPAHQEIVSRQKFIECGRELALQRDPSVDSIIIIDARQQTKEIVWIGEVEVIEVEVDWRTGENLRRSIDDVIEVDSAWRWVIGEPALRAFQSGVCPA